MRFWDASAVVPLLVSEPASGHLVKLLEADPEVLAWWGTPVECASAVARLDRAGAMSAPAVERAFERLARLAEAWHEIQPSLPLRVTAQRMLRVHPLRAADALQLAAAAVAAGSGPRSIDFVCLDERLSDAARREGFRVVGPSG